MKISFWTSTEYRGFLDALIRELRNLGVEAHQCYHISEASYRATRSPVARLFLRFRQYVVYPVQISLSLIWDLRLLVFDSKKRNVNREAFSKNQPSRISNQESPRGDVIVVSTNTFFVPLLATYLHPNVVHLVYDLFPEAMIHSGKWQEGTFKVRLVRWLTTQTIKRAQLNVFLGERLKDYVESIYGAVPNAAIIAVGADQALFGKCPKARSEKLSEGRRLERRQQESEISNAPIILYCGNFGNMHDSVTLFDYWKNRSAQLQQAPCRFYFYCSGPKRAALEQVVAMLPEELESTITLGGGLSQSEWVETMESAEVALVTMAPGAEEVVMPSKTYSAMMAGQAILAIAPEHSDLVDLIKTSDCGWWVKPGDVDGLARTIEAIKLNPEALLEKRDRAYEYAHNYLGQNRLAEVWLQVLENSTSESLS